MNPSTAAADLLAKERGIRWYKSIIHDEWPSRVTPLARFSWDQIKNGGVRLSRCFRYQGLQGWYLSHRQQNVKTVQINITRGTTDPGIESVTWVILSIAIYLYKDIAGYIQLGYNSRNISWLSELKQQSFLIGREQRETERGKPGHNTWIMKGSFWLVQIISCLVRGSRRLLEAQNTDCTLIPNPIDLRGWVSCTQFQWNSLISGHVFALIAAILFIPGW